MFEEKRKGNRVGTHIVAEIGIAGDFQKYCGYIENISENGIGMISMDSFEPGETVEARFYLTGLKGKMSPKALLVHSQKGEYNLYYHGFQFDALTSQDRQSLAEFINERSMV